MSPETARCFAATSPVRRVTRRLTKRNPGALDEEFRGNLFGLSPEPRRSRPRCRAGERATLRVYVVGSIRENDQRTLTSLKNMVETDVEEVKTRNSIICTSLFQVGCIVETPCSMQTAIN